MFRKLLHLPDWLHQNIEDFIAGGANVQWKAIGVLEIAIRNTVLCDVGCCYFGLMSTSLTCIFDFLYTSLAIQRSHWRSKQRRRRFLNGSQSNEESRATQDCFYCLYLGSGYFRYELCRTLVQGLAGNLHHSVNLSWVNDQVFSTSGQARGIKLQIDDLQEKSAC